MSNHDAGPGCFIGVLLLVVLFALTFCVYALGVRQGIEDHQQQAVEQGYAEYVVDQQGQVTWKWKNSE